MYILMPTGISKSPQKDKYRVFTVPTRVLLVVKRHHFLELLYISVVFVLFLLCFWE